VMYRPGVTGGLGLTLQNPNGHAITIDSIVPEMAAGGPIREAAGGTSPAAALASSR